MKMRPTTWLLFGLACLVQSAWSADYYVSPKGKNSNDGSQAAPWRSVQKAVNALGAGDTAWLDQGVYREMVTFKSSGSPEGGWVTLRALPGTKPVLDAAGLKPSADGEGGVILIRDRDYIRVEGLTVRGLGTGRPDLTPAGVFITGECDHIELRGLRVHHISTRARQGNAFGIAAYGTSVTKPISHLVLDGNEVDHCTLGSSESVSLNGNVTGFQVMNNRVHDNNNIGIVFIGYEGTCPDPALDQARDGLCQGNLVYNIKSYGNPAYGKNFSAGGIYVDGGTRIVIERNISHHCDIGVELASEHGGKATSAITLRENLLYLNRLGGLFLGGYDELRGQAKGCEIHHNTFYHNDTRADGNGEIALQHFVSDCRVRNNIVVAGSQKLLLSSPYGDSSGNQFDYNLYFAPGAPEAREWQWKDGASLSFSAYQQTSGQDAHSLQGAPLFVNEATLDFHLTTPSPARDAGDPNFVPALGESDFDGGSRQEGARVDLGADEL